MGDILHIALHEHDYVRTTLASGYDENGGEGSSSGTGSDIRVVDIPFEAAREVKSEAEEAAWYNLSKLGIQTTGWQRKDRLKKSVSA
jgi:hypothetical protein